MSHDNLGGGQGKYLYPCCADKEAEAKQLDSQDHIANVSGRRVLAQDNEPLFPSMSQGKGCTYVSHLLKSAL